MSWIAVSHIKIVSSRFSRTVTIEINDQPSTSETANVMDIPDEFFQALKKWVLSREEKKK